MDLQTNKVQVGAHGAPLGESEAQLTRENLVGNINHFKYLSIFIKNGMQKKWRYIREANGLKTKFYKNFPSCIQSYNAD